MAAFLALILSSSAFGQAAPIIYKGARPETSGRVPAATNPVRTADPAKSDARTFQDDPPLRDGIDPNKVRNAPASAYGRQYPDAAIASPIARPADPNEGPIPLNQRAIQTREPVQSPPPVSAVMIGAEPRSIRPVPPMHVRTDIVQQGDTLFAIANRNQTPIRALIDANALMAPFALTPGQTLRIPPPRQHVVEPGETLYSVSRRFNIDLRSLALLNRLQKPWMLAQGQTIILPALARDGQMDEATAQPSATIPGPIPLNSPIPQTIPKPTETPATNPARSREPPSIATGSAAPAGIAAPVRFIWPIEGSIVQNFGPQSTGQRIDGIRVKTDGEKAVLAAAAGTVVYAGEDLPGFGKLLLIKHAGGWVTAYAQVGRFEVSEGESVVQGQAIARTAAIANQTAGNEAQKLAILHFEVRNMKGRPVDPRSVLPQFRERG